MLIPSGHKVQNQLFYVTSSSSGVIVGEGEDALDCFAGHFSDQVVITDSWIKY